MKKSSGCFLAGIGLVLITAGPVFAQRVDLHQRSGTAVRIFNSHIGPADLSNGSVGSLSLAAANNPSRGSTATLNSGLAILTGVVALRFFQRRSRADIVLKPRQ